METKKELKKELEFYFGFVMKVNQILTSKLSPINQRDMIALTYAKLIWPDLWSDKDQKELNMLEELM